MQNMQSPWKNLRPVKMREPFSFETWFAKNKWSIIVLLIAGFIFAGVLIYTRDESKPVFQPTPNDAVVYEKATVLEIKSDTISPDQLGVDYVEIGSQQLAVRIETGMFAGTEVPVINNVSSFSGRRVRVGDSIIVSLLAEYYELSEDYPAGLARYLDEDGVYVLDSQPAVYSPDRTWAIVLLLAIFIAVTTFVGGKTGLKSLIGLAITIICIIWIMCPLLMKGAPMVLTALGLCIFVTVVCFVILGGVTKKTACAMLGTIAGVALAAFFGEVAQLIAKVNSYNMFDISGELEEFKNMQLMGIPLHITGVMTAGIIISSLGAVMDVAMSLSSSLSELKTVNPQLTFSDLCRSGMNIGRDMVGTMTNTLILAFAGSSLILIIWMWSLNLTFYQLVSSPFLSVELISALSSSIGVILAVPLTVLIGAAFYTKERKNNNSEVSA